MEGRCRRFLRRGWGWPGGCHPQEVLRYLAESSQIPRPWLINNGRRPLQQWDQHLPPWHPTGPPSNRLQGTQSEDLKLWRQAGSSPGVWVAEAGLTSQRQRKNALMEAEAEMGRSHVADTLMLTFKHWAAPP